MTEYSRDDRYHVLGPQIRLSGLSKALDSRGVQDLRGPLRDDLELAPAQEPIDKCSRSILCVLRIHAATRGRRKIVREIKVRRML